MPAQGLPIQDTQTHICTYTGRLYFTHGKKTAKSYIQVGDNTSKEHYVTCHANECVHHKELILEVGRQLAEKNLSSEECKELKQKLIDQPLPQWSS